MEYTGRFSEIGTIADGSNLINAKYIDNELAFLLEINRGVLAVYNISNPDNCLELDSYSLSFIHDIELDTERELVFVTAANGVNIFNYSNPSQLEFLSAYLNYSSSTFIQLKGELLFIGAEEDGLQIVNVTDPTDPVMISRWDDSTGDVGPVYVVEEYNYGSDVDDFAFVGTRLPNVDAPPTILDMKLLNVSDPTNITFVSIVDTGVAHRGGAPKAHIDDLVYLNDYNYGLKILNFSDPFNISVIGTYDDGGFFNDVKLVEEEIALLADDYFGLKVINCSNIESPGLVSSYEHEYRTIRVAIEDDRIYLATFGGGVRILAPRTRKIPINSTFILFSMVIGCLVVCLRMRKSEKKKKYKSLS